MRRDPWAIPLRPILAGASRDGTRGRAPTAMRTIVRASDTRRGQAGRMWTWLPRPPRSSSTSRGIDDETVARPAVDRAGVERPDQPDELRHVRVPEAVRLQPREGDRADARRAPQGSGGRVAAAPGRRPRSTCSASTSTACGPRCSRTTDGTQARIIPPIERVRDGFTFNIGDDERQLVARLLGELSQLLMGGADDPRAGPHVPTGLSPCRPTPKPTPSTSA